MARSATTSWPLQSLRPDEVEDEDEDANDKEDEEALGAK